MHVIQQAFGEACDLYKDVLKCPRDADAAGLRKAYYRRALVYHPDKQQPGTDTNPLLFQGISLAYQLLKNPETRALYDETGEIPSTNDDDDFDTTSGTNQWKTYFDQIFGKVTTSDIDAFAAKYKCSDEEKRDVLKEFKARKGHLLRMLDFVMLSQLNDIPRWVEDYIRPSFQHSTPDNTDVPASFIQTMDKTLKQAQKKIEKELQQHKQQQKQQQKDDDATETESDNDDSLPDVLRSPETKSKKKATKVKPAKAKPTKAKPSKKKKEGNMNDLIAQIQNKNRGGGSNSVLASLGSRYGVSAHEDDPLNDDEFDKIQARMEKKRKSR